MFMMMMISDSSAPSQTPAEAAGLRAAASRGVPVYHPAYATIKLHCS